MIEKSRSSDLDFFVPIYMVIGKISVIIMQYIV